MSQRGTYSTRKPAHRTDKLSKRTDGRWWRKYKGKVWYAKGCKSQAAAMRKYLNEWDGFCDQIDRELGIASETPREAVTLFGLVDEYVKDYRQLVKVRESSGSRTRKGHSRFSLVAVQRTLGLLCESIGDKPVDDLEPDDFTKFAAEHVETKADTTARTLVGQVKALFSWGHKNGRIDRIPQYGTRLIKPAVQRKQNGELRRLLFSPEDIQGMLDSANRRMKAAILLGINAAYGGHDVSELRMSQLDLESGWLRVPRVKNGNPRDCWLWPETREALRGYIANDRPDDAEDGRVFSTRNGKPLVTVAESHSLNQLNMGLTRLMDRCKCRVTGRNWHSFRRTFRSVAGGQMDEAAARRVMGHSSSHAMDDVYADISVERIQAVCEHVRQWLFGT